MLNLLPFCRIIDMPLYTYRNELTGEIVDILQGMNDAHEYFGPEGDDLSWKRVFVAPNTSIDSQIDPNSPKQFLERTASKKGTVGDMLDYSKEMSHRRAESNGGVDPVKQKYLDDYSKKRNGAKHVEALKSFETKSVKVQF
jgi:hypothetical protein